jgi:hypothetical protein
MYRRMDEITRDRDLPQPQAQEYGNRSHVHSIRTTKSLKSPGLKVFGAEFSEMAVSSVQVCGGLVVARVDV